MNRIEGPDFDDFGALRELSLNHQAGSYPLLAQWVDRIGDAYLDYFAEDGDASRIAGTTLDDALVAPFKAHYAKPPVCLPHIDLMRTAGRSRTCPMCGSMLGGTLDHVLPKAQFPCFSIFSANLVPACDCNSHRINDVVGPNGARILHPYFDDVLGWPLIAARFDDLGEVPRTSVRFLIDPADVRYPSVVFHYEKVVERTIILQWLREEWSRFVIEPGFHVTDVRRANPATRADLERSIREDLGYQDRAAASFNNWRSVFLRGLLDDNVLDWTFAALTAPGRAVGGPLVPGVR